MAAKNSLGSTMSVDLKNDLSSVLDLTFGCFLDTYITHEAELRLKEESPFVFENIFCKMKDQFNTVSLYSVFFKNGVFDLILEALISYTALSNRLPSRVFKHPLAHLETLLKFLQSHPLLKKESLQSRIQTCIKNIGKKTSLYDVRNFSGSLWVELHSMASFLKGLPSSAAGVAEFLEKKDDKENCDGRFVTESGIVTLLEFKNKNLSHGEVENDFKTSVNDFLLNHRFDLGTFIMLFYPSYLDSMPGFLVAWPLYYEEVIDDLDKVLEELEPLTREEKPKLKKAHEKALFLKMVDLYSQDTTNDKPGFLVPTDDVRIKNIDGDVQKVAEKEFWCKVFTKAINQLAQSKKCHVNDGYKVDNCFVYVLWQRPPSMYPDIFTEDPEKVLTSTFNSLKKDVEQIFSCCISNSHSEAKPWVYLRIFQNFSDS